MSYIIHIRYNPNGNYCRYGLLKGRKDPKGDRKYPNGVKQRTKRRYNKLKYINDSLYEDPNYLITINCPKDDIDLALKNINKFATRLRERFSDCWFIWKMECNKGYLHFHLIGDFGERNKTLNYQNWIQKRWAKIWNGISEDAVKVKAIYKTEEDFAKAKNYLTKKDKFTSDKSLVRRLGSRNNFGFINRKNVPMSNEVDVHMNIKNFVNEIKPLFIEDIRQQNFEDETERHARTREIEKSNYNMHKFYDPDLRKKFYKRMKKYSTSIN